MRDADILYLFGFGLGYSEVRYSDMKAPGTHDPRQPLPLRLKLANIGVREAREVVQIYVQSAGPGDAPVKLAAFETVALGPGEQRELRLELQPRDLLATDQNGNRHPFTGPHRFIAAAAAPGSTARDLGAPEPVQALIDLRPE